MGIFDVFGTSDQADAASALKAGQTAGYGQLSDLFSQGRQSLGTSLANSTAAFMPNLKAGQAGQGAYADATGANGAEGSTRALANFKADPSYQYNTDQQLQNILRAQEATGQAASGATNADVAKMVSGNAGNMWQSYIQNLSPFLNSSNAAATGISAANTNAGNQTNQNLQTQGNAAYGTQTAIGNANAGQAMAGLTASQNDLGGLMSAGKGVANIAGMFLADGGPAKAGTPHIVGERGPELFVPKKSGVVIPHEVLAAAMAARSPARSPMRKAA